MKVATMQAHSIHTINHELRELGAKLISKNNMQDNERLVFEKYLIFFNQYQQQISRFTKEHYESELEEFQQMIAALTPVHQQLLEKKNQCDDQEFSTMFDVLFQKALAIELQLKAMLKGRKKEDFFPFMKHHTFTIPDNYQFDRDELHKR